MTTEILRNMLFKGSEVMREVSVVIFDEVHYMRDYGIKKFSYLFYFRTWRCMGRVYHTNSTQYYAGFFVCYYSIYLIF